MTQGSKPLPLPADIIEEIRQRMVAERFASGLTQQDVADRLGVHLRTYGRWETRDAAGSWAFLNRFKEIGEILDFDAAIVLAESIRSMISEDLLMSILGEVRALRLEIGAVALRLGRDVPR
ncbi:MAG: helix-turn-helix domain-containing protein [Solirubrobacterales bacterium]